MCRELFIGIDGGGTHSTAVAALADGSIVAVTHGKGLNHYNSGLEAVRSRLEELVERLCARCGVQSASVCAGLSALDRPADEETLRRFCAGGLARHRLDLQSDAYIALMAHTLGTPGAIVICGTGSMLMMVDGQGRQHVSGGWGYLLCDAGSGYSLAREALMAVCAAEDGIAPPTPLTGDALDYFGADSPRGLIARIYVPSSTPEHMAGFAQCVTARADAGEPTAVGIVKSNMGRLARQTAVLIERAPEANSVGLYGGVFAHCAAARQIFGAALEELSPSAHVGTLRYPPELGALIHLFKANRLLSDRLLANMAMTYRESLYECD